MALLDGDNGMGHLVMQRAAQIAIEKARHCGVAWVGSRLSQPRRARRRCTRACRWRTT